MRLIFSLLFLGSSLLAFAQPKQNSPYSRYGVGDLLPQYFSAQAGMAGLGAAYNDPFHVNTQNPASYAWLRATSFEGAFYAKYSQYKSDDASKSQWSGNLQYLALGMTLKSPINEALDRKKSKWSYGLGFALSPYSIIGYNIQSTTVHPQVDTLVNLYEGYGGTYKLQCGGSAKYKNTAVGLNLGWVFGKANFENTTDFSQNNNDQTTYQDNFKNAYAVRGFTWNLGVQHQHVLKYAENDKELAEKWLTFGAYGHLQSKLNTTAEEYLIRSRGKLSNGQYYFVDTLVAAPEYTGKMILPAEFGVGVTYVKANKMKAGFELNWANWKAYKNDARPESGFRNTLSLKAGMEYIPNHLSYNSFSQRIRYRFGAYFRQDPRVVTIATGSGSTSHNINDLGVSFGFGLPITLPRQQNAFINTAFEIGQLGGGSPISETYFKMTFGFTLCDNTWFYKRRFE